jgi:hypothetical protein
MSEAIQRHVGPIASWLVFSGVTIGVVGASVMKHADSVGELVRALDSRVEISKLAVVAPAEWGLGLLIVGLVVALCGLVLAARRPNLSTSRPRLRAHGLGGSAEANRVPVGAVAGADVSGRCIPSRSRDDLRA